jgi:hypothetical protein
VFFAAGWLRVARPLPREATLSPDGNYKERQRTQIEPSSPPPWTTGVRWSAVKSVARVVFADKAAALEARMNGSTVESSTDMTSPESTSADLTPLGEAEEQPTY